MALTPRHAELRAKNVRLALLIGFAVLAITLTVFASRGVFG